MQVSAKSEKDVCKQEMRGSGNKERSSGLFVKQQKHTAIQYIVYNQRLNIYVKYFHSMCYSHLAIFLQTFDGITKIDWEKNAKE